MPGMTQGRYIARPGAGAQDLRAAQALRHRCFRGGAGLDQDGFDARSQHLLIEDRTTGALVGCCRLMGFGSGAGIADSYAAQHYDLGALARYDRPMLEIGRFCTDPDHSDPDILRIAWGALARMVDAGGIGMLFGCSSFRGTDPAPYRAAFAWLRDRHPPPPLWRPGVRGQPAQSGAGRAAVAQGDAVQGDGGQAGAVQGDGGQCGAVVPGEGVLRFDAALGAPDPRAAMLALPPLLRSYLLMGAWVSDHAVIDRELNTLHVFTGLEIAAIPPARVRALRAIGG